MYTKDEDSVPPHLFDDQLSVVCQIKRIQCFALFALLNCVSRELLHFSLSVCTHLSLLTASRMRRFCGLLSLFPPVTDADISPVPRCIFRERSPRARASGAERRGACLSNPPTLAWLASGSVLCPACVCACEKKNRVWRDTRITGCQPAADITTRVSLSLSLVNDRRFCIIFD